MKAWTMLKNLSVLFVISLISYNLVAAEKTSFKGYIELSNNPGKISSRRARAEGKDHLFSNSSRSRFLDVTCLNLEKIKPFCNVMVFNKRNSDNQIKYKAYESEIVFYSSDSVSMLLIGSISATPNNDILYTKIVITEDRTRIYEIEILDYVEYRKFYRSKNLNHKNWRLVGELK